MRKLPKKIRKNGFGYTQILCCGDYYIYEQDYNSGIDYNEGDSPLELRFYEVFKVRVRPAETIKGKSYPKREVFPKDCDFGTNAWAYETLEMALDKLIKLKGHK